MPLEEAGVLTTERCHLGFLCGEGLAEVGWKDVCRQPCASCQLLEAWPGRQLQRAACPRSCPFWGTCLWWYLVTSGHKEYESFPDTQGMRLWLLWHFTSSYAQSGSYSIYKGGSLVHILTSTFHLSFCFWRTHVQQWILLFVCEVVA